MPSESTARAPMPSDERDKQRRRIASAIRNGLCMSELVELFKSESRIKAVAEEHGLVITKRHGGRHL